MSPAGWTDFLEQHLGRWSFPHLARGLVAMNAASWLLNLASPGFLSMLKLDPALVLQGEFWRVFTFVFVPPSSAHPIFFFIFLWFLWSIGEALEETLGSFHLNLYFLVSMVAVVAVSFLQPAVPVNSFYLFNSLFLGFATTLPDQKIFLFPIPIPLSVVWVAGVTSALLFVPVFFEPALLPGILAAHVGYLSFFGPGLWDALLARFRRD